MDLEKFGIIGSDYPDLWKYGGNLPDEFNLFFSRMRVRPATTILPYTWDVVMKVFLYAANRPKVETV